MNVLFRTDASPEIGTGHVMRCLSLMQTLRDEDMTVACLFSSMPEAIAERLKQEQCVLHTLECAPYGNEDVKETVNRAKAMDAQWIVVDGYNFDASYQEKLKKNGFHVLFVDDYGHAKRYSADIVLNQNAYADEKPYKDRNESTMLLLGPRFVLLGRGFLKKTPKRNVPDKAQKLLVTLGGADPDNMTATVIEAVEKIDSIEVTIVIGGGNPNLAEIEKTVEESDSSIHLVVNATNMPELMSKADLAISGGGTTSYELAYMGLPTMSIVLAKNQCPVAEELDRLGIAINLGWHKDLSAETIASALEELMQDQTKRKEMSERGQALIDGKGARRVCNSMHSALLTLRPAQQGDVQMLFEWANDPLVRESAFSSEPIPLEDHKKWFEEKLADTNCLIYIGLDETETPIGQIRFNIEGKEAEIDVHLAPDHRGRGLGTGLIKGGLKKVFDDTAAQTVHAYAKEENTASVSAFRNAGFEEVGKETKSGFAVNHFLVKR